MFPHKLRPLIGSGEQFPAERRETGSGRDLMAGAVASSAQKMTVDHFNFVLLDWTSV